MLFFILSLLVSNIYANEPVVVHTQYGDILGYETNMSRIFYGIPFAQPPVGPLRYSYMNLFSIYVCIYLCLIRWQSPVPIAKWSPKIINATYPPPACPQPPVPHVKSVTKTITLPVVSR